MLGLLIAILVLLVLPAVLSQIVALSRLLVVIFGCTMISVVAWAFLQHVGKVADILDVWFMPVSLGAILIAKLCVDRFAKRVG